MVLTASYDKVSQFIAIFVFNRVDVITFLWGAQKVQEKPDF